MNTSIVKIEHLYHRYARAWAIQDINIEVGSTGVLGLLGSNGAGKSTTMNILCGVLNQTKGQVYIDGIDVRREPRKAKRLIGFLPQNAPLYPELTVDEYLIHAAYLRLMDPKQIPAALAEAKERCGISHFSHRLIRNLSGGYRQRVGIAQSIIHRPRLVVMDEPTNGLDPNQITEVRKLIREIAQDRVVIFSSHILSEVQAICKDIKMIEQGRLVFSGTMDDFNNHIRPQSLIVFMMRPPELQRLLSIPGVSSVEQLDSRRIRMRFASEQGIADSIIRASVLHDWGLEEISLEKYSLDEVFASLSQHKAQS